jgi:predicted amidohydrolase YtcJ
MPKRKNNPYIRLMKTTLQAIVWVGIIALFGACSPPQVDKIKVDQLVFAPAIYSFENDSFVAYTAMAIQGDSIVAIGLKEDLLSAYSAEEQVEHAYPIFPGLIDAHCHFWGLAQTLLQVNLEGCRSWSEVVRRCQDFAFEHPDLEWVTGRGWDESLFDSSEIPSFAALNELFPDKPVFIRRVDGHTGIANRKALEIAGLSANTRIPGGKVDMLTGLLVDNAMEPVKDKIPPFSQAQMRKALEMASTLCTNWGLTTLADAGLDPEQIALLDSMQKEGTVAQRLYVMLSFSEKNVAHARSQGPIHTDWLRVHGFKFYADGALGSMGAHLKQPYCHQEHQGLQVTPAQDLEAAYQELYTMGFQAHTHCIGDSANALVLRLYHKVLQGDTTRRWRIEHAQVLDLADLSLFGRHYILPSVQPIHATSDMRWAEKRLCSHRMQGAYAYQTLLQQTGILALGTDFPVESPDPFRNFFAAIARQNAQQEPAGGFLPENKLTRQQALRGMTQWAAYSLFMDKLTGSLRPGQKADYIVLDRDILQCAAPDVLHTKVLQVYIGAEKQ